jgi:UDP-3-O-[3-hydroxymyristoyl] glucosamine N-acyltransferase
MTEFTVEDMAKKLGAEIFYSDTCVNRNPSLSKVAGLDRAGPTDIAFLTSETFAKFLATTKAGAVIVAAKQNDCPAVQIVHKNPYWAFATMSQLLLTPRRETGLVSDRASIEPSARLGTGVTIYPNVYVSEGCEIGDGCVLFPGVFLGRGVRLGDHTVLRASVTVEDDCVIGARVLIHANTTIGADGFGFAPGAGGIAKIPQVGIVRIEDDVEVGGGTTIDRATLGETVIGRGTKIDSCVHIGHNVIVGEHTMICGGVTLAGSAKIGNWVVLAGRSSVSNKVEIADRTVVGGLAGVTKSIDTAGEYMGFPAVPARQWRRQIVEARRFSLVEQRLRKVEDTLETKTNKD